MPKIGPDERVRKPYRERDRLLKSLGWTNYAAYLASPVWRRIRKAHIKAHPDCLVCEGPAQEVHHLRYTAAVLEGSEPSSLASLCRHHHAAAEFEGDGPDRRKRTPEEALAALIEMAGDSRRFIGEGE
jgi:hypothetical protein